MYATLFDDPGMINSILPRYLSTTAEQIQAVCRDVFVAGQPARLDVPAGRARPSDRRRQVAE